MSCKRIRKKRALQGFISAGVRRPPKGKWMPSEARVLRGIKKRFGYLGVYARLTADNTWVVRMC